MLIFELEVHAVCEKCLPSAWHSKENTQVITIVIIISIIIRHHQIILIMSPPLNDFLTTSLTLPPRFVNQYQHSQE